jgi:sugar/nucleoside kinase (ribokinase family)
MDIFLKPRRQEVIRMGKNEYIGFCLGDKVRIDEKEETFGGGGANVAVGLSRFGISTAVLGKIGDDESGEKILANLQNEGVSREYLQVEKKGKAVFLSFSRHLPGKERFFSLLVRMIFFVISMKAFL